MARVRSCTFSVFPLPLDLKHRGAMQRANGETPRLVVFVGLAGCLFLTLLLLTACGSAADRTLEQTIERTYALDPTADIRISNRDGSIRIYGSDTVEMKLQAIKKAYTAERLNDIVISVAAQPNSISIETKYLLKKAWGFSDRSGTVDYVVVVPQAAQISRLELENGEVLVEGMRGGKVKARLGSGRLFGHNCFSDLDLAVMSGNLTLAYDWWEESKFSAEAKVVDGHALAFLPSDAGFHLIAEAVHGKIANDFAEKEQRQGGPVHKIDMRIGESPEAEIKIHAADGNIRIAETNP